MIPSLTTLTQVQSLPTEELNNQGLRPSLVLLPLEIWIKSHLSTRLAIGHLNKFHHSSLLPNLWVCVLLILTTLAPCRHPPIAVS